MNLPNPGDPDYFDPLPTELEQIQSEVAADMGTPDDRAAHQGLKDMLARIDYHAAMLDRLTTNRAQFDPLKWQGLVDEIRTQMRLAEELAGEYRSRLAATN